MVLATEKSAAEWAETLPGTKANATLSAWALWLAQVELRAVLDVEQAQRLALLEEINLVQTESGV